jgi:hypothetical protein
LSWQRAPVAAAIADVLSVAGDGWNVTSFATPPETLNPPAYVCAYPRTVTYDTASFGVDLVEYVVGAYAGPNDPDTLDELLAQARAALSVDPGLAGTVQSLQVTTQSNWRRVAIASSNVNVLAADLILEIRM